MSGATFSVSTERAGCEETSHPARLRSPFLRFMIWCAVVVFWYRNVDWRAKRPLLVRVAAHLSVLALVLATIFFVGVEIPAPRTRVSAAGGPFSIDVASFAMTSPPSKRQRQASLSGPRDWSTPADVRAISRLPVPHTSVPKRPRARVVTYTVQRGDTLSGIAARFDLSLRTIIWSNREALQGLPWLIRPGLELFILPVDGVYHTVQDGETVVSIAADYDVDAADVYNEWNDLNWGRQPRKGQRLVVPGGEGGALPWQPPVRYATPGLATRRYEVCDGEVVEGPGGHGWFTYPTGRSEISGWVFHDPRHPMHIGLDYRCKVGDPIYAADNGVVTKAGRYGTYGIMVEINHGNCFITRYAHFNGSAVACGDSVYQGDLIGYCGNTGWSSGSHLHFEIRHDNVPLNPQFYLPQLDRE
jgi:murein DD-endopeptidase MepM/ murein hydrolase activator NlpD